MVRIDIIKSKGGDGFDFKVFDRIAFSGQRQSARSCVDIPQGPVLSVLSEAQIKG